MTRDALDTASGVRLDLDAPRPADIRLSDVAGALSRICRFGGQAQTYYSVAQHAVLVAELVERAGHPELGLAALHHDSHEAFACDLPSPLKRRINAASDNYYEKLCQSLDRAIDTAFGIGDLRADPAVVEIIKDADQRALLLEARKLLHDGGKGLSADRRLAHDAVDGLPELPAPLDPRTAEQEFLAAHARFARL